MLYFFLLSVTFCRSCFLLFPHSRSCFRGSLLSYRSLSLSHYIYRSTSFLFFPFSFSLSHLIILLYQYLIFISISLMFSLSFALSSLLSLSQCPLYFSFYNLSYIFIIYYHYCHLHNPFINWFILPNIFFFNLYFKL